MIRYLHADEADLMAEGGEKFYAEGRLPGVFNRAHFCAQWKQFIEQGIGVSIGMFTESGQLAGALGAIFYQCPFTGDQLATEQFFFVIKEYRGKGMKLLEKFVDLAVERGVNRVAMVHLESLHPEALKRVYERIGFRKVETCYIKELPCTHV